MHMQNIDLLLLIKLRLSILQNWFVVFETHIPNIFHLFDIWKANETHKKRIGQTPSIPILGAMHFPPQSTFHQIDSIKITFSSAFCLKANAAAWCKDISLLPFFSFFIHGSKTKRWILHAFLHLNRNVIILSRNNYC